MLRRSRVLLQSIRCNSSKSNNGRMGLGEQIWDHDVHEDLTRDKSLSTDVSSLPFNYRRGGESFGQIVKDYHHDLNEINESKIKVIAREDILAQNNLDEVPVNHKLLTSQDERLHPLTLEGRTYRPQIKIPDYLTKRIYNHMIALHLPKIIKYNVAQAYVKLGEDHLYKPTKTKHEVDTHIAAFFTQNYGSTYQVIKELFKRRPDFKPDSVLDIGYGPSIGMLALNEVLGNDFEPKIKDSVIIGNEEMQNRAKVLLSRQINEYTGDISEITVNSDEEGGFAEVEEDNFIGEVKTNKIKIKTKLFGSIPYTKKYDLIIAQHQLLTDINQFPLQIDDNLDEILKRLNPNGILLLVERGTPQGFENIARARQIMIRPENHLQENGIIPRPYMKGAINELDDEELLKDFEIVEDTFKNDFHLSVVAPCTHHKKCPLQTLKPVYYDYPVGKKKLNWCSYEKSIERPRFLLELKRGKVLSSRWELPDVISPSTEKYKGDSGRFNANNYELTNYSYLIVERSANDAKTIEKINQMRKENAPVETATDNSWARIIKQPLKRKGHVTMGVCNNAGDLQKWTVTKSFDRQSYHDARKAKDGDLWTLPAKTVVGLPSNQDEKLIQRLENYEAELKLKEKTLRKLKDRKDKKQVKMMNYEILNKQEDSPEDMINLYTDNFNISKRQRQKDKKGGIANYTED